MKKFNLNTLSNFTLSPQNWLADGTLFSNFKLQGTYDLRLQLRNEAERGLGKAVRVCFTCQVFSSELWYFLPKRDYREQFSPNTYPLFVNNNKNPTKTHNLGELGTNHPSYVGMWQVTASTASVFIFKQQEIEHGSLYLCRKERTGLYIKNQTPGLLYLFPQSNGKREVTLFLKHIYSPYLELRN